jgi:hypothetical protein
MCVFAFPQFNQLEIEKSDLEGFYSWLYGPSIGGRSPPPSVYTLMMAERNTWREITRKMHLGKTLRVPLQEMQHDLLFWQREVYEKLDHQLPGALKGKGSRQFQFQPHKGQNQKSAGKGKFSRPYPPFKGFDK